MRHGRRRYLQSFDIILRETNNENHYAGAGAVGTHLAKLLSDEKQDIILMDENEEKLSKLDSNFDLMTVNASPTSISGLKNAGVAGADLFIGVMPEESRNMTACMLATNMGAKKTVARIDNLRIFYFLNIKEILFPTRSTLTDLSGNAGRQKI